jgi:hypothetical protein
MRRIATRVFVSALLLLFMAGPALAQATAQISGTVRDESGAVLPGVTVTVTQTDTGFTRTVVTDATGAYVVSNLPTGPYEITTTLSGFSTYRRTGIVLQVGASPVINVVMGLSQLQETVTVEAATPLVDVQSAGIGEVVEQERILELPLQGRQVTDLIVLAGAAVQTGTASSRSMTGGVSVSVAGGLSTGVAYTLDGAIHNNPHNNMNLPLPFPDALQEFRVATSGLSADNGVHSGASVQAVTKSGTNLLHGNVFEFLRDRRFNATQVFAEIGPDGKRLDDGLNRNQYGGTLGGPIVRDRVFFFGGYQGTRLQQRPTADIANVPTAAMLAGDFTAITSPPCTSRPITLRAPFVNNRVDPALFSPAALNLAGRLPKTDDPCGEIRYQQTQDENEWQAVGKVDLHWSANHSVFGRYIATSSKRDPAFLNSPDNVLTVNGGQGRDNLAQTVTLGSTYVLGTNTVHSFRFAFNRSAVQRKVAGYFAPADLGIAAFNYSPVKEMGLSVDDGFSLGGGTSATGIFNTNDYQVADDLTVVRGRHQLSLGGNLAYWKSNQESHARSGGAWTIDGSFTGLGLADLLLGRVSNLEHGGPSGANMEQRYLGLYAADTWRASHRVTLNLGLRWEPFFGQQMQRGDVAVFSLENFRQGVRTTTFSNAPAGFLYPGDRGFPEGKSGMNKQWGNLSPRVGVAWDVTGDGRTALRASYGIGYDFPTGEVHLINATSPPFGNRVSLVGVSLDNPYAALGGDPHPILTTPDTEFPPFGAFGTIDPDINSPRVQSWNVTVERQIGDVWQAAVSYLGRYSDRLWGTIELNPGTFFGSSRCTIPGPGGTSRTFPNCSTAASLNFRRELYLENPDEAQFISNLNRYTDLGTQEYRGLKLSVRRRAATGISFNANYTWSYCWGNSTPVAFLQLNDTYKKPEDPSFDAGNCGENRTHIGNITVGYLTPELGNAALSAVLSNWRIAGILNARSGRWLTVDMGPRVDVRGNGIRNQRVNQISNNIYGDKSLARYLNRDAFERPAPGTYGNHVFNSIKGPGFWQVDLAVSKLVSFGTAQTLEFRVEAFNLFNNFNWDNPVTNFTSGLFGRIRTQVGDPRIVQFGVKYGF